jgi:hypothetical protein
MRVIGGRQQQGYAASALCARFDQRNDLAMKIRRRRQRRSGQVIHKDHLHGIAHA